MKRYMVFVYSTYYPCGGMRDFVESYDTSEEAETAAKAGLAEEYRNGNWQVLDIETGDWWGS